jgi:hypothetical protein
MVSLGVLLVVLGIASIVLPSAGVELAILDSIDSAQPWLGIIVAALGLITILYGQRRRASVQTQTTVVEDRGATNRSDEG